MGAAQYPEHGSDAETLLKRADIAMYHAKEGGAVQCATSLSICSRS
ncbi:hypothetical protein C1H71_03560 [Iodobacter fluviatilis]|uniref:GGDEF domain-containing protein n=1 Tax=Iodobacter fluviatilis TaxID=537 RepID=A0A7G3G6D2_9NEIS|nr:hypothetical protein C1H71_03560 [Iodobacter fluviatilis]